MGQERLELRDFLGEMPVDLFDEIEFSKASELATLVEPYLKSRVSTHTKAKSSVVRTYERYRISLYMPDRDEYVSPCYNIYGIRMESDEEYESRLQREMEEKAQRVLDKKMQKQKKEEQELAELARLKKKYEHN